MAVLGAWCVCVALTSTLAGGMPVDFSICARAAIDEIAGDEQHVAGHDGHLARAGLFDHDGHGPQLAFLPRGLARPDAAADDHRIIGLDIDRRRADAHVAGHERRHARSATSQAAHQKTVRIIDCSRELRSPARGVARFEFIS